MPEAQRAALKKEKPPPSPSEDTSNPDLAPHQTEAPPFGYPGFASWALIVAMLCALPLLLTAFGVDFSTTNFSTANITMDPQSAQPQENLPPNVLALQALRGTLSHTLLEWSSVCAALFLTVLCFTRYQTSNDTSLAVIGTALFCTGVMDAFHSFAADQLIQSASAHAVFIPYSWALSRISQGALILTAVGMYALLPSKSNVLNNPRVVWVLVPAFALFTMLIIKASYKAENLPTVLFPNAFIQRPFDLYSLLPFLVCATLIFPLYVKKYPSYFAFSLWLSAIPQLAVGLYMTYGSTQSHDNAFNIAHGLKIVAYLIPMAGLIIERIAEHEQQVELKEKLLINTKTLLEKQRDFESAQYQMSATADFAESLNKIDAQDTYQTAIETLSKNLQLPFAALYLDNPQQGFHCQFVTNLDSEHIAADEIENSGFPLKVFREAKPLTLAGPFDDEQLVIRFGIGRIKLCAITGWPIIFQGNCIGVLVVGHITQTTEQQLIYINASLDQLGVRIYSFSLDEQRKELFKDLEKKSIESERASKEAMRANQVKTEFLANMSHELRTPMNSIIGFNKRLLNGLKDSISPRNYDALITVDRNARLLLGLINDILDLSKIEAGRMELSFSEINMGGLVQQVLNNMSSLLDRKDIELKVRIHTPHLTMKGDVIKIQQILNNLVSNAAKYTEHGYISVGLKKAEHPKLGTCVLLSVADTGVGISEENQHKLFQKFTQFDSLLAKKVQGTGLGLSITAEFIRMHNGLLEIISEPNKGSEFLVFLPTNCAQPSTTNEEKPPPPLPYGQTLPGQHHEKGMTLLCIDDDDNTAHFLQDIIQQKGAQVAVIRSQQDLLDQTGTAPADLICIELESCDIKSLLRVERIKSEAQIAHVPMIIIAKKDNANRFIKNGAIQLIPQHLIATQLEKAIKMRTKENKLNDILIIAKKGPSASSIATLTQTTENNYFNVETEAPALEIIQRSAPDIIVLDATSTALDHFSFLEQLFNHEEWSTIPIILLTQQNLSSTQVKFFNLHAKEIISSGKYSAQLVARAFLNHLSSFKTDSQLPGGAVSNPKKDHAIDANNTNTVPHDTHKSLNANGSESDHKNGPHSEASNDENSNDNLNKRGAI